VNSAKARRRIFDQKAYKRRHGRRVSKLAPSLCLEARRSSSPLDSALPPSSAPSPSPSYPSLSPEPALLTNYTPSPTLAVPLPANILYLASLPLPEDGDLFKQALKSADALDESELDQWDRDPPYVVPGPQDTPSEIRWTGRLEEVMHGRRMRRQREVDKQRQRYYHGQETDLRNELERVVGQSWADYDRIENIMRTYHGGTREMAMGLHLLRWKARDVYYTRLLLSSLANNVQP
jgi:hypothetical protein